MNKKVRGNGQGSVFKLPNGKWRAEVTLKYEEVEGKKKRVVKTKSGFRLKKDALAFIETLRKEQPNINLNISFSGLYDLWSKHHYIKEVKPGVLISKSTVDGYKNAYKYCETIWGSVFAKLKKADLQQVIIDCPHGQRTKADIKSLLINMYKYALDNDYVEKNYAANLEVPKKQKSNHDAFTKAERDILWADYNAGNKFTGEILFLIYMGLRFGEFAILTTESFHRDDHYIIGGIKSEAGINRVIPIADCIYSIATELCHKQDIKPNTKKVLTVHEKGWYTLYHVTMRRLGIRDLDPHCCRHTTATALAECGTPPAIITAILGHEDYDTTLGYTHISVDEMLKWVNQQYIPSSSGE